MTKILVVEDDDRIYYELKKLFENNGFDVIDGRNAGNFNMSFDLAVLDIGLPDQSGYDICMKIRETKNCPVIFLTSMDKPENELMGFAVGGDDFITKPFNRAVLLARINRHLKIAKPEKLQKGDLVLDAERMEVKNKDKSAGLSKTEFAMMKILLQSDKVIMRKEFIEKLWDDESYIDENTLYVNINRLREKLKGIGLDEAIITVRGAGYRLSDK